MWQARHRGPRGRCKRAAWTSCGLKGRVCYKLPSLTGNPQAEQAPSHLPADVTAARRDREGGERRDLPTQKNISHGVCPSVDAAERWGTYLRIPTKRYRYINYECLFPYIEPAAPGKKRKKGGGAAHREKALALASVSNQLPGHSTIQAAPASGRAVGRSGRSGHETEALRPSLAAVLTGGHFGRRPKPPHPRHKGASAPRLSAKAG